jgi:hypothetical protein
MLSLEVRESSRVKNDAPVSIEYTILPDCIYLHNRLKLVAKACKRLYNITQLEQLMTDVSVTPTIYADIASGCAVNLKTASAILGLNYHKARRRILRDGLNVFRFGGQCYVHVSDLSSPRLRIS